METGRIPCASSADGEPPKVSTLHLQIIRSPESTQSHRKVGGTRSFRVNLCNYTVQLACFIGNGCVLFVLGYLCPEFRPHILDVNICPTYVCLFVLAFINTDYLPILAES